MTYAQAKINLVVSQKMSYIIYRKFGVGMVPGSDKKERCKMIRPFMSVNEKDVLVVEDLENSDLSYDFDIMNDYDNSLSEFNGLLHTLNAIGIYRIEASSSIEDFEESEIDPYIMNSFLKDTGLA